MDLTLPAPLGLWLVGVEGFQGILTAQPCKPNRWQKWTSRTLRCNQVTSCPLWVTSSYHVVQWERLMAVTASGDPSPQGPWQGAKARAGEELTQGPDLGSRLTGRCTRTASPWTETPRLQGVGGLPSSLQRQAGCVFGPRPADRLWWAQHRAWGGHAVGKSLGSTRRS